MSIPTNQPYEFAAIPVDDVSSGDSPNIEYLVQDEFGALEDDTFNEFCAALHFDPFHPEGENEMINHLIGKRKREPETFHGFTFDTLPNFEEVPSRSDHSSNNSTTESNFDTPPHSRRASRDHHHIAGEVPLPPSSLNPVNPPSYPNTSSASKKPKTSSNSAGIPAPTKKESTSGSGGTGKGIIKPRIPKKDIRNSYASIFTRAFNTCDREILQYCLTKYAIPECQCVYKYVGAKSPYGGEHVQVIGVETIAKFWEVLFLSMPDAVFEIQENKIRVLPNGSCASVSKFIFTATKVYKMSTDDNYESVVYSAPTPATEAIPAVKTETTEVLKGIDDDDDGKFLVKKVPKSAVDYSEANIERSLKNVSLSSVTEANTTATTADKKDMIPVDQFGLTEKLEKPEVFIIIGTFTIFANPEKKIYKFEFIHSIKQ